MKELQRLQENREVVRAGDAEPREERVVERVGAASEAVCDNVSAAPASLRPVLIATMGLRNSRARPAARSNARLSTLPPGWRI